MIRLENVSTLDLIRYVKSRENNNKIYKDAYTLLMSYGIDNFQELEDLLESGKVDYEGIFNILNDYLQSVIKRMNNANEKGRELEIFTFDNYKNSLVDDETLNLTDNSNSGEVLLYTIPYIRCGARRGRLRHLSITQIKKLLMYVDDYNFQNLFSFNRCFGLSTTTRVANLVDFYEQQVLRQAAETDERGINLFTLNKDLKDEMVEAEIKYIAEYIIDNAKECIWGEMSDTQKKRIMSAVMSFGGESLRQDRMALVSAISNYTTLSELEQGVIKKRTLDRFIVR